MDFECEDKNQSIYTLCLKNVVIFVIQSGQGKGFCKLT